MSTFDFATQMSMSHGVIASMDVESLLMSKIVGATGVRKASATDDKQGTDYFVDHVRGVPLSVDVKARGEDPVQTRGQDDLALETWSVVGVKKGWTIDESKRTDYILWLFATTKRYCLVPFHLLRLATKINGNAWRKEYGFFRQPNRGYESECMFVPRAVVWRAIYDVSNGVARNDGAITEDVGAQSTRVETEQPEQLSLFGARRP